VLAKSRTRSTKKSNQKSVHILTIISMNTLCARLKNQHENTIQTSKPVELFNPVDPVAKSKPASTYINFHQIGKPN
jgi:hypothetical protein